MNASIIKKCLRWSLSRYLWDYQSAEIGLGRVHWSQFGEDILIMNYFRNQKSGFYVDVGAFHPLYLSNTYGLYRQGNWRGLAIDANAEMGTHFAKYRPRDRFIHTAVGAQSGTVVMAKHEFGAFDCIESQAENVPAQFSQGVRRVDVPMKTLAQIFMDNQVGHINFMNIDCEGSDMVIIESNDWSRWAPDVICVEDHSDNWMESALTKKIISLGYSLLYRADISTIFRRSSL